MSITKIEINGKDYKIECEAGEEKLLFNAVNMINEKIKSSNELKKLSESKMFLIISLMLAGELSINKNKIFISEDEIKLINDEILELKKELENYK